MIFPSAENSTLEKSGAVLDRRLANGCNALSLKSHPLWPIGNAIKPHGLFEASYT
jgi:hypothetical protein